MRQSLCRVAEAEAEEPHQQASAAHSARTSASVSSAARRRADVHISGSARRCSAHTAMARTSGEASPSRRSTAGSSLRSPELPAAISALRTTRSRPVRLTGVPAKRARKAASSSASSSSSARRLVGLQRLQARLARGLGELVPRAHGEAIVAAEHAVADRGAELGGDVALVLDGQVGDAAARIELVGRGEGVGRANVEAALAAAAMVDLRRVGLDLGRGQDGAEEQPGAVLARDEVGVLALPAEARRLPQRLLHQRRGVDEHLHVGAAQPRQPAGDALQAGADHVMVVASIARSRR